LLRGSLRGRLDSALMIKWLDWRWLNADTTCAALNEGLSGTYSVVSEWVCPVWVHDLPR
jgi:hypothetical protein